MFKILWVVFSISVGEAAPRPSFCFHALQDSSPLGVQLHAQAQASLKFLWNNISPSDAHPGVIVASPSRSQPNYYYDWVRDSMIVWKTLLEIFDQAPVLMPEPAEFRRRLMQQAQFFVEAQRKMQDNGPGEPKHNVDTSAFTDEWGRPQNDGPGLRLQVMVSLVRHGLLDARRLKLAFEIMEADVAYIDTSITKFDFDIWEETRGFHFYNRVQMAKGVRDVADLLQEGKFLGALDPTRCEKLFRWLRNSIRAHTKGIRIVPTVHQDNHPEKTSYLDVSVLLALLHSDFPDWLMGPDQRNILLSVRDLVREFQELYPINKKGIPGTLIGRYPEDRYDGVGKSEGHGWFLATLAVGEYVLDLVRDWERRGFASVTRENQEALGFFLGAKPGVGRHFQWDPLKQPLLEFAEAQLERVLRHRGRDGSLSEQANRKTGHLRGAENLSWSHAAFLNAYLKWLALQR